MENSDVQNGLINVDPLASSCSHRSQKMRVEKDALWVGEKLDYGALFSGSLLAQSSYFRFASSTSLFSRLFSASNVLILSCSS